MNKQPKRTIKKKFLDAEKLSKAKKNIGAVVLAVTAFSIQLVLQKKFSDSGK